MASTGFQSTSLTGWSSGILVKIIVITASGIKITASERIMSPAVADLVGTRHVLYLHRRRQIGSRAPTC